MSNDDVLTISAVRNDGKTLRLSLRGDDGTIAVATIEPENVNKIVNTLVKGFITANVTQSSRAVDDSKKLEFKPAPQLHQANDVQFSADLDRHDVYLIIPTTESVELQIALEPHQLRVLIELAQQCEGLQSGPEAIS